jgi:hypothetical protein
MVRLIQHTLLAVNPRFADMPGMPLCAWQAGKHLLHVILVSILDNNS